MYRKHTQSWRKHLDFIIIDLICLQIAFILAFIIRHSEWNPYLTWNPYATVLYRNTAIVLAVTSLVTAVFMESFRDVLKRGYYQEFLATLKHDILVILISILYLYVSQSNFTYSRLVNFYTGIIYFIISYIVRIAWKHYIRRRTAGAGKRTLLIVTTTDNIDSCITSIKSNNYANYQIVGLAIIDANTLVDIKPKSSKTNTAPSKINTIPQIGENIRGISIVADENNLIDYVCSEWIDEILVDMPMQTKLPDNIMRELNKIGVVVHIRIAKESDMVGRKQFTESMGDYTVLTTTMNYASPGQLFIKRTMDIIGGIIGCIITLVFAIIITPIIKIMSPGPLFFTQIRVGQNGKHFKIHKFRTMYMDAEKRKAELIENNTIKDDYMFKLDFDPRVIGNKILPDGTVKRGIFDFFRRYSIDELPQFYDVLIGNMSLVGTRPPTVEEVEKYSSHHYARLAVKPGITGMWQVNGRSNITDFEEVVRLDTEYINTWDLGLDIKILFKTFAVVLKGEGSK